MRTKKKENKKNRKDFTAQEIIDQSITMDPNDYQFSRVYEIEKLMPSDIFEPLRDLEYYHEQVRIKNRLKLMSMYKQAIQGFKNNFTEDDFTQKVLWDAQCETQLGAIASLLSESDEI